MCGAGGIGRCQLAEQQMHQAVIDVHTGSARRRSDSIPPASPKAPISRSTGRHGIRRARDG
jgi:hypothetical protein